MTAVETIRARASALYALDLYLPMSHLARLARARGRALRGRPEPPTRLPQSSWRQVLGRAPVRLVETRKRNGNVNLAELAVLALAASQARPDGEIIEIGTFDGRTTLNFALNAPAQSPIVTLDLPPEHSTAFPIEAGERLFVDKPVSGERLRAPCWHGAVARVRQVFGDSASYDWTPHVGRASLVFVDGSHAYDYVRKDSDTALRLVAPRGVVIWHDYGVWPGVTRGLEQLEAARRLGLRQIRGTSLVLWRRPLASDRNDSAGQA